jgi:fructoselysine 6-kinase
MKIACMTVAAMDHFFELGQYCPGGNALNQAVAFRRFGHETAFVGALGDDPAGREILELLGRHGVDTGCTRVLPGATASNRLYNDAAGERFGEVGAWNNGVYPCFELDAAAEAFLAARDVWSTHANCPLYGRLLALKTTRQRLVVDYLHFNEAERFDRELPFLDIAYVGGEPAMADGLAALARRHPNCLVVLTLGSGGSRAWLGQRDWRQAALPVPKVVDTTGCGDAFQAACSAEYLVSGDVGAALLAGALAGRACCQSLGAITWADSRKV